MNLGPYDVKFSGIEYQAEPTFEKVISVMMEGTPSITATMSLEEIQSETNLNGLLKYAKQIYSSELAPLRAEGASLSGGNAELRINGRHGFEISFSFPQTMVYVIGFWLNGNDAIFIFAKAPKESNLRERIITMARNIIVNVP
jgi:hypothetical protein